MNKPKSWRHVAIDANQVEDGDRAVFDSKDTPNPNILGEGIHNLELIDIAKHCEDIIKECIDRLDMYEVWYICALINSFHHVFAVRNDEGNYFPIVVRDTTGDTVVLVTDAKFYRGLPDEETGMPLTCDEFQQQMEQEKEKGMELSSDEFMTLLKERKPSDEFDDTMIDAAMEQLPTSRAYTWRRMIAFGCSTVTTSHWSGKRTSPSRVDMCTVSEGSPAPVSNRDVSRSMTIFCRTNRDTTVPPTKSASTTSTVGEYGSS